MSLLTSALYPALTHAPDAPAESPASYTLTHTGAGWSLTTRYRTGALPGWSTPLAPHGASLEASARVAQAVAVRVLHELGIEVERWRAVEEESTDTVAVVAGMVPTPRRGLRGH